MSFLYEDLRGKEIIFFVISSLHIDVRN